MEKSTVKIFWKMRFGDDEDELDIDTSNEEYGWEFWEEEL